VDGLHGAAKDEFTRMQHKRVVILQLKLFGEITNILTKINVRSSGVRKRQQRPPKVQVDAGGLDIVLVQGVDHDAAFRQRFFD
jgi:hypothetical protein